jgi:hypothetical protein
MECAYNVSGFESKKEILIRLPLHSVCPETP